MKLAVWGMAAATVVMLGATLAARGAQTVSGELIELNCYLKSADQVGEKHKDCATICARQGKPLAILAGSELYIIKGDWTKNQNEKLIDLIARQVSATGEVSDVNGKKLMNVADLKAAK